MITLKGLGLWMLPIAEKYAVLHDQHSPPRAPYA